MQLLSTLPPSLAVRRSSHLNGTRVDIHHPVTIKYKSEAFPSQPRTGPKENQKDRYVLQTEWGSLPLITIWQDCNFKLMKSHCSRLSFIYMFYAHGYHQTWVKIIQKKNKSKTWNHVSISSTQEPEAGGPWVQGWSESHGEDLFQNKQTCTKNASVLSLYRICSFVNP